MQREGKGNGRKVVLPGIRGKKEAKVVSMRECVRAGKGKGRAQVGCRQEEEVKDAWKRVKDMYVR